jgi:hypothetical protein
VVVAAGDPAVAAVDMVAGAEATAVEAVGAEAAVVVEVAVAAVIGATGVIGGSLVSNCVWTFYSINSLLVFIAFQCYGPAFFFDYPVFLKPVPIGLFKTSITLVRDHFCYAYCRFVLCLQAF